MLQLDAVEKLTQTRDVRSGQKYSKRIQVKFFTSEFLILLWDTHEIAANFPFPHKGTELFLFLNR